MPVDDAAIATAVREFADSAAVPSRLAEQVIVAARARSSTPAPLARRGRRGWLPIAVAVSVAAVALLVGVLASSTRHDAGPAPAGSHSATGSPAASATSPSPRASASSRSATVSSPAGRQQPPPSSTNVVTIGGAALNLPAGWTAEPNPHLAFSGWCLLLPGQSHPANGDTEECAATFLKVPSGSGDPQLSPDTTGGIISNPEWCGQVPAGDVRWRLLDYRDKNFGGRDADYRRWMIACTTTGITWRIEQYVVDSAPGYILYSSRADGEVHAALASIAASAHLPRATGGLRYSDLGRVRAVTHDATGYHLRLERVVDVQGSRKYVASGGQYDYFVANSVTPNVAPKVGSIVQLTTDGRSVTTFNVLVGG